MDEAKDRAIAAKKARLLEIYGEKLIPLSAFKEVGIGRRTFEVWRETDAEFDQHCRDIEADTLDNLRKMVLQKLGLVALPNDMTEDDQETLFKFRNDLLLINAMKYWVTMTEKRNSMATAPKVVKGLPDGALAAMTAPETPKQSKEMVQ